MAADYEIGHFIRERIVPRAVLYFTGEALDDDDFGEEEEEEASYIFKFIIRIFKEIHDLTEFWHYCAV